MGEEVETEAVALSRAAFHTKLYCAAKVKTEPQKTESLQKEARESGNRENEMRKKYVR